MLKYYDAIFKLWEGKTASIILSEGIICSKFITVTWQSDLAELFMTKPETSSIMQKQWTSGVSKEIVGGHQAIIFDY